MVISISKNVYVWYVDCTCREPRLKQIGPHVAENLNVMVVSSLFSMQLLTHIPLTGV